MSYQLHWSSLLTQALWLNVSQQLTLSTPARRTPSKKDIVLTWADHLPHTTKEDLHDLFNPLTLTVGVFAPVRYKVIKIACFCSKVVLQTMKNYKAHYSLSYFSPLL
jgi:hypothetical protein